MSNEPRVLFTSLRTQTNHYAVNNLIDGGLKIVRTNKFGKTHFATISSADASTPIRFIIELLEKYEPTDVGRIALEHYLNVIFAYWHD